MTRIYRETSEIRLEPSRRSDAREADWNKSQSAEEPLDSDGRLTPVAHGRLSNEMRYVPTETDVKPVVVWPLVSVTVTVTV